MPIGQLSLILVASIIILFILSVNINAKNNPINPVNTQVIPQETPMVADSPKYSYMGCYITPLGRHNLEHVLEGGRVSAQSCHTVAVNMQANYFAIGNVGEDGLGTCTYGDNYIESDASTNCVIRDDAGNLLGGSFAEAAYEVL